MNKLFITTLLVLTLIASVTITTAATAATTGTPAQIAQSKQNLVNATAAFREDWKTTTNRAKLHEATLYMMNRGSIFIKEVDLLITTIRSRQFKEDRGIIHFDLTIHTNDKKEHVFEGCSYSIHILGGSIYACTETLSHDGHPFSDFVKPTVSFTHQMILLQDSHLSVPQEMPILAQLQSFARDVNHAIVTLNELLEPKKSEQSNDRTQGNYH